LKAGERLSTENDAGHPYVCLYLTGGPAREGQIKPGSQVTYKDLLAREPRSACAGVPMTEC